MLSRMLPGIVLGVLSYVSIFPIMHLDRASALGAEFDTNPVRPELLDVHTVKETLDAVQQELLIGGLCQGGEHLEIYMRQHEDEPAGVIELIYRVDDVLHIYRYAYAVPAGLVVLADRLDFRDSDSRYSIHKVRASELAQVSEFPVHINVRLSDGISEQDRKSNEDREKLKKEWMQRP